MRYFVSRLDDGTPTALARTHDHTAERLTRTTGARWETYPALAYLALGGDDMSWDEVDVAAAKATVKQMGYPRTLVVA